MDAEAKKFFEDLTGEVIEDRARPKRSSKKQPEPVEEEGDDPDLEGQLTIDVYQTPSAIVIESPIAGVNTEDLDVNITPESVTIQGHRERSSTVEEEDYIYQECYWGRFSRSVILPEEIDPDRAEASVKNGVLRVSMPKISKQKGGKRLKVKED